MYTLKKIQESVELQNEATDLYDKGKILITRFGGKGGSLNVQINSKGKFIQMSAFDFAALAKAMPEIVKNLKDKNFQGV